jgi:hypothetical protein
MSNAPSSQDINLHIPLATSPADAGHDDGVDWGYEAAMPYLTGAPHGDSDIGATWAPHIGA